MILPSFILECSQDHWIQNLGDLVQPHLQEYFHHNYHLLLKYRNAIFSASCTTETELFSTSYPKFWLTKVKFSFSERNANKIKNLNLSWKPEYISHLYISNRCIFQGTSLFFDCAMAEKGNAVTSLFETRFFGTYRSSKEVSFLESLDNGKDRHVSARKFEFQKLTSSTWNWPDFGSNVKMSEWKRRKTLSGARRIMHPKWPIKRALNDTRAIFSCSDLCWPDLYLYRPSTST